MNSIEYIGIAGAMLVWAGTACKETVKGGSPVNVADNIDKRGRKLGLALPTRTHIVGVKRERGIDDAIFAKIEIPPAYLPEFLRGAPFRLADLDKTGKASLPPDDRWWDPNNADEVRLLGPGPSG